MKLVFTIILLCLSLGSEWVKADAASSVDSKCVLSKLDPFDLGWRISKNSKVYADLCMNSATHRPIQINSESEQKIEFVNFYHDKKFWTATWFKDDLPIKVSFQFVHFNIQTPIIGPLMKVAHLETRFRFSRGLQLRDPIKKTLVVMNDVVVDWEASPAMGFSFDPIVGFRENEPIVGRITSTEARVKENLVSEGILAKIQQLPVHLSPAQAGLMFLKSIQHSNSSQASLYYSTLSNNCATKTFEILDLVLQESAVAAMSGVQPYTTSLSLDPIQGPARDALLKRGLIRKDQPYTHLAPEFGLSEVL